MLETIVFIAIVVIFGILPMIFYSRQEDKVTEISKPNKIFVIITISIIFINTYLAYITSQGSIGFILGKVLFLPLIIIGLFSLSRKSRNWKSRFNILFYTGLVILLSSLGDFL